MKRILEYVRDDWQYRLPQKWANNRYGGLSRPSYAFLCFLYYLLKDVLVLYFSAAFFFFKFILWDIWKLIFCFEKREWYKRLIKWYDKATTIGFLRTKRRKLYGNICFGIATLMYIVSAVLRFTKNAIVVEQIVLLLLLPAVIVSMIGCAFRLSAYNEDIDIEDVETMYDYDDDEEMVVDTIDSIDQLSGSEFEHFCADLLRKNGYTDVRITSSSGDQGIDILAEKDNISWAFQCKRYTQPVGNIAVREAFAGKAFYHCDIAVVITTSTFTAKAEEYARETGVLLWDRIKLMSLVQEKENAEKIPSKN